MAFRLALLLVASALLPGCPSFGPFCGGPAPFTPGPPVVLAERGVRTTVSIEAPTPLSGCGTSGEILDSGFSAPSTVTVSDPSNALVAHEVVETGAGAQVSFTPAVAGTFFVRVNFEPNRGSAFAFVNVAETIRLDGGRRLATGACDQLTRISTGLLCDDELHFPNGGSMDIDDAVPGSARVVWSVEPFGLQERIRRFVFPDDGGSTPTISAPLLLSDNEIWDDELGGDDVLHLMGNGGILTVIPDGDGGLSPLPIVPRPASGPAGAGDPILIAGHGRLFAGRAGAGARGDEWAFCEIETADGGVRIWKTTSCAHEPGYLIGRTDRSAYVGDTSNSTVTRLHAGPAGIERLRMNLPFELEQNGGRKKQVPVFEKDEEKFLFGIAPEGLFLQRLQGEPSNVRATEELIWTWDRTDELDVFER